MHPAKGRTAAGGLTCLSLPDRQKQQDKFALDSGTADSGFLSGQNLSSDSFTSTPDAQEDSLLGRHFLLTGIPQKATASLQQEEDSQTFDSGVDLDSSLHQQISGTMRVDNMEELCKIMLQLQVNQRAEPVQAKAWEKLFHQNEDGDTFLHLAIIHEATDVVNKLISAALRSWLDIQNDFGQTPLHLAVLTGQAKIVRELIVAGAVTETRDAEGNTALHLACLHGKTDCAQALLTPLSALELQKCKNSAAAAIKIPQNLEQWNFDGKRCIHLAAENSNLEILRYLVNAGADVNSREGKSGYTVLHYAIETGNEQIAAYLLTECPRIGLEQITYGGLTAYQLATLLNHSSIQHKLRSRGAEPLTPPESDYEEMDSE
ncbi:NF-kappa-B inhibitor cactus-like [Toxorhynchites rutilus septentrionalis]|uniref:NF-kappa-B inhibitor cactus-like n=1 Tax=Toxorhynchites rutilus septentrionalis TaxID=329112 RepID=UPI0024789779|nr:NF-kappa-B inhibitor cactus-like [Toxorhynchites rutilus septentrionalis]